MSLICCRQSINRSSLSVNKTVAQKESRYLIAVHNRLLLEISCGSLVQEVVLKNHTALKEKRQSHS
jgi:hypothetical protein